MATVATKDPIKKGEQPILAELRKAGLPLISEARTPRHIPGGYFDTVFSLIGILQEVSSEDPQWKDAALNVYNLLRVQHEMLDKSVIDSIDHEKYPKTSALLEFCLSSSKAA